VDWIEQVVLSEGKVNEDDLELMHVTDDIDEAVAIMVQAREERQATYGPGGKPRTEPHRAE
jgi:hypothetical protein